MSSSCPVTLVAQRRFEVYIWSNKKIKTTRRLNTTDEYCGINALGLPLGHFCFNGILQLQILKSK